VRIAHKKAWRRRTDKRAAGAVPMAGQSSSAVSGDRRNGGRGLVEAGGNDLERMPGRSTHVRIPYHGRT